MRLFGIVLIVFAGDCAWGQALSPPAWAPENVTPATDLEEEEPWSFSASAYTYIVPEDRDYVQPTLTADRGWLHLEARYNYENLDTGSVWVGYNLSFGEEVTLDLTPMVGGVIGDTTGVAPGYEATLSWWKLELYTEGEYVFDTDEASDSFFYTWSEFTLAPTDWVRVGMVVQRTKTYEIDFDIQRGFLVGFTYKDLDLTACVLNPDDTRPVVMLGVGLSF